MSIGALTRLLKPSLLWSTRFLKFSGSKSRYTRFGYQIIGISLCKLLPLSKHRDVYPAMRTMLTIAHYRFMRTFGRSCKFEDFQGSSLQIWHIYRILKS
jgi:hypothetical protein